jgi:dolichol-phosphate hexosyltransferase
VAGPAPTTGLSVLMPVYNEAATVEEAVRQVSSAELPVEHELIVVDDGSTDGTGSALERRAASDGFRLLRHEHNQGKGAAVRTGLGAASGEFAAIFDADLEYDPRDLRQLLEPLTEGLVNASFGVRAFGGYTSHSFVYVMGNRLVTLAANVLFNVYLRDLMTCQKVIRTEVFQSLPLREPGFGIEAEITARLLQRGERIFEVPVHYHARSDAEGKKLKPMDGVRVLRTLARCRLSEG